MLSLESCVIGVRKKGQEANPYEDYREFPSVFCLKINHGGTFTPPPMTRYKGGKVNWVDDIDSDTFSIVDVTKLVVVDKDVYEMLMYVDKFKVIELYTDHTVKKQHVLTQEPLATIIDVTQPGSSSGNEAEVDVSEDEWLRESLKKLPIKSKKGQQSSRKEVGQSSRNGSGSENGSGSDSGSDSEDSDYFVDEENLIEDVDVDMAEFKRHTDPGVEWLGCKENVLEENEVFELEEVDHEEFDSGSDSDEGVRRKALRKVPRIVSKCTATFLSKDVEETIKPNDKITLNTLKDQLQKKFEVGVSKQKVFRAKKMAYERVVGSYSQQYAQLRDYCMELKEKNPNTTVKIEVEPPEDPDSEERKFKRIYICLGPLKDGFKAGGRDFLVEYESKDSWKVVLDCIGDDLEAFQKLRLSLFISEGKRVCYQPIAEVSFHMQNIVCLKIIYAKYELSWRGRAKSNILLNNLCEVLNRQLSSGSDKPILTCLRIHMGNTLIEENCDCKYLNNENFYLLVLDLLIGCNFPRNWELSGIPCTHAVASIWDQANNGIDTGIPESYCLPVHWLTTWKEMYKFKINPVNGPQGWKKSDVPTTIIPPKPHPQIGRPPKKRKKSAAELADEMMKSKKLTKTGKSVTCKSLGGGSQQAGVAGHGDAAHGSQQAGVHGETLCCKLSYVLAGVDYFLWYFKMRLLSHFFSISQPHVKVLQYPDIYSSSSWAGYDIILGGIGPHPHLFFCSFCLHPRVPQVVYLKLSAILGVTSGLAFKVTKWRI
ncbi:hypothetical protein Tco_0477748 [Tanacetum coccineum]